MASAQQYEVAQAGFAAVGPVLDVVSVDKSGVCAAREAATPVSNAQCTAHRGWNRPGSPADGQRFAIFVLFDAHNRAIAGDSP